MQLEEIHYLTVEFQQWDKERQAEEAKKATPEPVKSAEPKVDLEQVRREASERTRQ